jgi:hypothetical protein
MRPEVSLICSQELTTGPCLESYGEIEYTHYNTLLS